MVGVLGLLTFNALNKVFLSSLGRCGLPEELGVGDVNSEKKLNDLSWATQQASAKLEIWTKSMNWQVPISA